MVCIFFFLQNLSFQIGGAAYLWVRLIHRTLRYLRNWHTGTPNRQTYLSSQDYGHTHPYNGRFWGNSLNKAIIRERPIIPTIDDVLADLNGCKVFSKIDLNQGYHQIPLHPDSRPLTTFSTHVGLFRYRRLNFGISFTAEIFQKKVSDAIQGIPCVKNISDDIYVGGIDKDTHDHHLPQVFHQLHENGLTINLPKCQFRVPTMLFFGHVFSVFKGVSPDPRKVEALQSVAPPTKLYQKCEASSALPHSAQG